MNSKIESLVREKVEDELKSISLFVKGRESRELSKTTKEFSNIVLPDIAKIITVAVSAAVATAVKDITTEYSDMLNLTARSQTRMKVTIWSNTNAGIIYVILVLMKKCRRTGIRYGQGYYNQG